MLALKRIITVLIASAAGILLIAVVGRAQAVTSNDDTPQIEQYLDKLIARATIAGDSASIIKGADSYRSQAKEKLKLGRQDEARRLLRQAAELIAAAAPDGDVKHEDPLLREYLRDITQELVALDLSGTRPLSERMVATSAHSHPRVSAFLNYFQGRGRNRLEIGRARLANLRPMMAQIFREEGVPEWLISVGFVESTYSPTAHSPAEAHGIWQFIPGTGQRYGLKRTEWTDERSHPERSTRAAARYLRDLHALFGDWPLALAAYNWGEGRVSRVTQRTGIRDFWTLADRGLMPEETVNYVPAVIAAAQLLFDARFDEERSNPASLMKEPCLKSLDSHLEEVSTASGSDLVEPWESKLLEYRMLITDQVATARCTDLFQE